MNYSRIPRTFLCAVGLALVAGFSTGAFAQATRTWVSGVGDDVNPCSRTAPCKTWAGAISKTAVGGEIDAMDDGGFGALTITKAVTINGGGHTPPPPGAAGNPINVHAPANPQGGLQNIDPGGGHTASALVTAGNAINVNAPANAQVVLQSIDLVGTNTAEGSCTAGFGVSINSAASVLIDDVDISGFGTGVSATLGSSSVDVFVDVSLDDVRIHNNCQFGVRLDPAVGHPGRMAIDHTSITGSNTALSVAAGGEAWVSNSRIYLNNTGVQPLAPGKIHSYCNNQVAGNATDGSFTDDLCGQAPATPPSVPATTAPTTALAYCQVPKLKKKTSSQAATLLKGAGCALGKVKKHSGPTAKKGKVVSQKIPAGTFVKLGTAVGVVIGK